MDIDRVISRIRNLKETPTNNISGGDIGTYDKFLFPPSQDLLSQDYQTPGESGQAKYRFSNVYPVQKLSLSDIDTMVDASKEYTNMIDDKRMANIMNMVRSIKEEAIANSVGDGGGVAGLTGEPPVNLKKKRKPTPIGRYGTRRTWMQKLRNG
ncbi:hypothetical protein SWZG_00088 [Synechococcus phage S-SKS1]|uniref:Uncharacterized protein n=1 Tax=Synechococcus phage S-SKS1 TaxID=754042 RepID=M4QPC9_9CAUD|nr:hypothetical protein SWZG_00088 [Synechococcus phage S-SKS1]AGH31601.1 hypothetical protein SWZG_00088 [Synechococcus phage S-SKS1]